MSRQIREGETLDDIISQRRIILDKPDTTLTKTTVGTNPSNVTQEEDEGGFFEMLKNMGGDIAERVKGSMKGKFSEVFDMPNSLDEYVRIVRGEGIDPETMSDDPGLVKYLAPGGAGFGSAAGRAGYVRRFLGNRVKSAKVLEKAPKLTDAVGLAGKNMDEFEVGVKMFGRSMGGPNPSTFNRVIKSTADEVAFKRGMIESFRENIANTPRITKAMRDNMVSPAGRARLKYMLDDMPPDKFDEFMALLERGQLHDWRRHALMVAIAYPTYRFIGQPIWNLLSGGR